MKRVSFVIIFLLLIDQISKIMARMFFTVDSETLAPFEFQFTENTGIAFSIPFPPFLLIIITLVILGFLSWAMIKESLLEWEEVGVVFIFSGALGNLIDRIFYGSVTDFIKIFGFPIFNFADIWITAGIVIFLWYELIVKKFKSQKA